MNKIPLDLNLTHYLISLHLEPKKNVKLEVLQFKLKLHGGHSGTKIS